MADTTSATPSPTAPRVAEGWRLAARALLDGGRAFAAHDLCRDGLAAHPGDVPLSLVAAAALARAGATTQARRRLEPVLDHLFVPPHRLRRLHDCLRAAVAGLDDRQPAPVPTVLAELAEAMELARGIGLDADLCATLAGLFHAAWQEGGDRDELVRGRDLWLRAFHLDADPRHAVAAALSCRLMGERAEARRLAERAKTVLLADSATPRRYDRLAILAAAHLLAGERADAAEVLRAAHLLADVPEDAAAAAWRQLTALRRGGVLVPDDLLDLVKAPAIALFVPGQLPHLRPEQDAAWRRQLEQRLEACGARIGYAVAGGDGDLMFIEAMLDRGAQVHVVLPFALDDVLARAADSGGRRVLARWRNALALAASVTCATAEPSGDCDALVAFAGQCLHGLAVLHGNRLGIAPLPVTIAEPAPPPAPAAPPHARQVLAVLVATIDMAWTAQTIPAGLDVLTRLHNATAATVTEPPLLVSGRGTTVVAVAAQAAPLAEYALTLHDAATRLGHHMRLWLHAGPLILARNPFGGTMDVHGDLPATCPVTVAGPPYASRQFAAMLAAEQMEGENPIVVAPVAGGGDDDAAYLLRRPAHTIVAAVTEMLPAEAAAPPEPPPEIDIESALAAVAELMEQADAGGRRKPRRKKPQDPAAPELALGPAEPGGRG